MRRTQGKVTGRRLTVARRGARATVLLLALTGLGCATIPKEAPDLSAVLGQRISALEESHRQLLGAFFAEKRGAVDRYIEEVWVPTYSEEILKEPVIGTLWDQVCREGTQRDRLEFLRRIGPRIQVRINAQRQAMVEPLDEVERAIGERLRSEYDQARSVNNALTSFLSSASKVEANRERYLGMLGIRSPDIEEALGEADSAVGSLAHGTERVEDATQAVEAFRKRMEETRAKVRDALRGK